MSLVGNQRAARPALEHTDDQLVRITATGMYIDPRSITALHAIANAQRYTTNSGKASLGKVLIETRNSGSYTIPCDDMNQARQLRDTLAMLCNKRTSEGKKPKIVNGTDHGNTKLMGSEAYDKEVRNIFAAFD